MQQLPSWERPSVLPASGDGQLSGLSYLYLYPFALHSDPFPDGMAAGNDKTDSCDVQGCWAYGGPKEALLDMLP